MKVSKVVAIVVALHVLVIGGIFVFEGCSRAKTPASQLADNESQPGDKLASVPAPVADTNLTSAIAPAPAPAPTPVAPAPAPVTASKTYAVKKGDTLYKIAKAEKTTIEQLAKANNLTKVSMLKVGQKLTIPAAMTVAKTDKLAPVSGLAAPAPSLKETALAPAAAGNAYEVKTGTRSGKSPRTTTPPLPRSSRPTT